MSKSVPEGLKAHQAERRRRSAEAVLEAAAELFVAEGYAKTSMAQIAKAAEVSTATLYKAFPSKEAVFRAMVARELYRVRAPFQDGLPRFQTAREAGIFVVEKMKLAMSDPRIRGLTWIGLAESKHFPELADLYQTPDGRDQTQTLAELVFSALIAQGLFQARDVPTAVRQFMGMVNQALVHEAQIRREPIPDLDAYLEDCVDLFCERYAVKRSADAHQTKSPSP